MQWRRQLWGTGVRAPSTSKAESQSKYCVKSARLADADVNNSQLF